MRAAPLTRLDRYRLDAVLGAGGMGTVYRGFDETIDRVVAVKVIHPHLLDSDVAEELEKRFRQEARAAARCMHPNIVTVFDYGFDDSVSYLVMEYVEGVELKALLKNQTDFTTEQAVDVTLQLLEALAHAHAKGVVHRDIKPANILLLDSGLVKLSDFGVAHVESSDLTSAHHILGTPNYMSPEGQAGRKVDGRGDLFTLALVLLELVSGKRLNARQVNPDAIELHLREAAVARPQCLAFLDLLQQCLRLNPDERLQNAGEFSEALKEQTSHAGQNLTAGSSLANTVMMSPAFQQKPTFNGPGALADEPVWQPEMLKELETSLSAYVGPIAKALVRKHADRCGDLVELGQDLANHIDEPDDRKRFIRSLNQSGVTRMTPSGRSERAHSMVFAGNNDAQPSRSVTSATSTSSGGLKDIDIDKLVGSLTEHMGPLARQLVKREMQRAADADDLYRRLADKIPNSDERGTFLKAIGY